MGERRFDVGPGFVRAKECPDCFHTKCGEDCVCNCDAAHAETEAAWFRGALDGARAQLAAVAKDRDERLKAAQQWVADLQSGMYVNCVYCGHRYGPDETTPVSMADALRAHAEQCPQHPMAALRAQLAKEYETNNVLWTIACGFEDQLAAAQAAIRAWLLFTGDLVGADDFCNTCNRSHGDHSPDCPIPAAHAALKGFPKSDVVKDNT